MIATLPRAVASATLLAISVVWAQQLPPDNSSGWITTWAASPQAYAPPAADVNVAPGYRLPESIRNQTIRQVVHLSTGARQLRIRLSNEFGTKPVTIGAAAIAVSNGADRIKPGTSHPITFGGRSSVVIAPGAPMLSDPVAMDVAAFGDVAISLYLPEDTRPETIHVEGLQTAFVSTTGNMVANATLPGAATFMQRIFLSSIEVRTPGVKGTIVTLGDSITDGEQSRPDANQRWPDMLARRLASASGTTTPWAVANEGISGNALLHSAVYGGPADANPSALARFDRDVGALSDVRYLIVADGVNDIDSIGMTVNGQRVDNPAFAASADDMIGGYQQLIARAHAHGIRIIGATIMPYEGEGLEADGRVTSENAFSPAKEAMRNTINRWIRESHAFDGVIDFDAVVRDPGHPSRLLAAYDSGDHIHPSASGISAMANSIDLALLH
jgi:lysophospholipase L1-like esterase